MAVTKKAEESALGTPEWPTLWRALHTGHSGPPLLALDPPPPPPAHFRHFPRHAPHSSPGALDQW